MASSARIDELLKKFDENPRRYFAPLANEYRKAGDVDRAIQLCREHLPQQPGHMSGHIVFGQALFEARQFDEARQVFESALALDPENLIALRHLGDIARDNGDMAGAREWYQRVLDADPRNEEIAAQIASLDETSVAGQAPGVGDAAATDAGTPFPAGDSAGVGALEPLPIEPTAFDAGATGETTRADAPPSDDFATRDFVALDTEPVSASAVTPTYGARAVAPEEASTAPEPADAPLDLDLSGLDGDVAAPPTAEDAGEALEFFAAIETEDAFTLDVPATSSDTREELAGAAYDVAFFASPPAVPEAVPSDAETAAATPVSVEATPGEEAPAPAPEHAAARASEPSSSVLGLETMEFVPPSSGGSTELIADPMLGHTVRESEPAPATPSAFVTETMAELYLQQGFRDEALSVYKQLLAQHPGDENLRDRIAQLEGGSRSSVSAAALSDSVIEAARQRHESREPVPTPAPTVKAFFGALAARRPARESASHSAAAHATDESAPIDDDPAASHQLAVGYDEFGFPSYYSAPAAAEPAAADVSAGRAEGTGELPPPVLMEVEQGGAIEPATLDFIALEADEARHADVDVGEAAARQPSPANGFELVDEREETDAADSEAAPAGAVDTLFHGATVETQDDAAAAALAGAFGGHAAPASEPAVLAGGEQGADARATRPARGELSLDHVFRDTPRRSSGQRRATPGFSFDQFFADSSSAPGGARSDAADPATARASHGGTAAPGADESPADIEQFNAWLEGLKKK